MSGRVVTVRTIVSTVHHWPSGDELIVREHVTDTKENLVRRWRSNGRSFRETPDGGLQYEDEHSAPGIVWTSTTTLTWQEWAR